jgi:YHS domain-containing protein
MTRCVLTLGAALVVASAAGASLRDDPAESREIPPEYTPFEYLLGQWKGQGIPKEAGAQQFRGWTEKHAWSWTFSKGKPTGLSVTIEGGKIIASGKLTFDPKREVYRLEGKTPEGKTSGTLARQIAFEGKLDSTRKQLVLARVKKPGASGDDDGEMRISVRPNANFLRYTLTQERKAPGAATFSRTLEIGVTKEGETFAAGAAATERGKCIVTGGLASMSVNFEGKSYPLCCSGCLGEFNDNPQKYVKKAALLLTNPTEKPAAGEAAEKVRGRDDAFANDVVDSTPGAPGRAAMTKKAGTTAAGNTAKAARETDDEQASTAAKEKPTAKKETAKTPAARAATLVRLGRALERAGKTEAALANYREVVKDFASTPSAKTASERIKALEKE